VARPRNPWALQAWLEEQRRLPPGWRDPDYEAAERESAQPREEPDPLAGTAFARNPVEAFLAFDYPAIQARRRAAGEGVPPARRAIEAVLGPVAAGAEWLKRRILEPLPYAPQLARRAAEAAVGREAEPPRALARLVARATGQEPEFIAGAARGLAEFAGEQASPFMIAATALPALRAGSLPAQVARLTVGAGSALLPTETIPAAVEAARQGRYGEAALQAASTGLAGLGMLELLPRPTPPPTVEAVARRMAGLSPQEQAEARAAWAARLRPPAARQVRPTPAGDEILDSAGRVVATVPRTPQPTLTPATAPAPTAPVEAPRVAGPRPAPVAPVAPAGPPPAPVAPAAAPAVGPAGLDPELVRELTRKLGRRGLALEIAERLARGEARVEPGPGAPIPPAAGPVVARAEGPSIPPVPAPAPALAAAPQPVARGGTATAVLERPPSAADAALQQARELLGMAQDPALAAEERQAARLAARHRAKAAAISATGPQKAEAIDLMAALDLMPAEAAPAKPAPVAEAVGVRPSPAVGSRDPLEQLRETIREAETVPGPEAFADATRDPLTGLLNAQGMLARERRRPAGTQQRYVVLDLDNFKAINDTLGHEAGDRAIQVAAEALRRAVRTGDAVRLHGDEFAVVLPGHAGPEVAQRLERVVTDALREAGFGEIAGRRVQASAAIGDTLAEADKAMFARKQARGVSQPRETPAPPPPAPGPGTSNRELARQVVEAPYETVDARTIQIDPETYQFKRTTGPRGETGRLAAVERWDPLAGRRSPIVVHERLDGTRYVADGHQRVNLAQRLLAKGQDVPPLTAIVLREADGWTVPEVRRAAALLNIQEGSASPLDIARVIRERPLEPFERASLPKDADVSGTRLRQGEALARLGDSAFQAVVNGEIPESYGAVVGRILEDPAEQLAAVRALAKADLPNAYQAEQFVRALQREAFDRSTQLDLFGEQVVARSLAAEKAKILDAVRRHLSSAKRTFGTVEREAGRLSEVGNVLAREANRELATRSAAQLAMLDQFAHQKGATTEALHEAARQLAAGEIRATDAIPRILDALERDYRSGVLSEPGPGPARAGLAGEGPPPALPGAGSEVPGAELAEVAPRPPEPAPAPPEATRPPARTEPETAPPEEAQAILQQLAGRIRAAEGTAVAELPFRLEPQVAERRPVEPALPLERPSAPEPPAPPSLPAPEPPAAAPVPASQQLPGNVLSFLTRQLRYTPEQIDAMGVEEALALGERVRQHPQGVKAGIEAYRNPAYRSRAEVAAEDLARRAEALGLPEFDPLARALGYAQRRPVPRREGVPVGPAAPPPPEPTPRMRARTAALEAELAQEPPARGAKRAIEEARAEQRRVAAEAAERARLLDDPTPENLDEYIRRFSEAAERAWRRVLTGGTGRSPVPRRGEGGELLLAGFPFGPLQLMVERPDLRWTALRMVGGGLVNALLADAEADEVDPSWLYQVTGGRDPLVRFLAGAAAGAAARPLAARLRAVAPALYREVRETLTGPPRPAPLRDLLVRVRAEQQRAPTELPAWRLWQQPHVAVPDVWRRIEPALERLGALRAQPPEVQRLPEWEAQRRLLHAELDDTLAQLAREARAAGLGNRAAYLTAMRGAWNGWPTALERALQGLTQVGTLGLVRPSVQRVRQVLGGLERAIATNLFAFAFDTALINKTQLALLAPWLKAADLRAGIRLAGTPQGQRAAAFLRGEYRARFAQIPSRTLRTVLKAAQPLSATDVSNAEQAYLSALQAARRQGLSATEAHEVASYLTNLTQGVPGEFGQNPFLRHVGPLRLFTKYPTIWAEWLEAFIRHPDPSVRRRGAAYLLGMPVVLSALGLNPLYLVAPTLPLSPVAARGLQHAWAHAIGRADHPLTRDLDISGPGGGGALPRWPVKLYREVQDWVRYGAGRHPEFSAAGEPTGAHTGIEGLLRLFGLGTLPTGLLPAAGVTSGESAELREARRFAAAAQARQTAESREARRRATQALEAGDLEGALAALERLSPAQRREYFRRRAMGPAEVARRRVPRAYREEFGEQFRRLIEAGGHR
jgi:diguanylate cyclase (GGDEF)-like protein